MDDPAGEERATIGRKIRWLRHQKNISLATLSDRAEISVGHLSQVERGQSTLTSEKLARVAGVLEVSADYLLGGGSADAPPGIQIPPALAELSEELQLTYAQTLRLYAARRSLVARRSTGEQQVFTKEQWREFHNKVKEYL